MVPTSPSAGSLPITTAIQAVVGSGVDASPGGDRSYKPHYFLVKVFRRARSEAGRSSAERPAIVVQAPTQRASSRCRPSCAPSGPATGRHRHQPLAGCLSIAFAAGL